MYNNSMVTDSKHFESLYPIDAREKEISEIVTLIKEGSSCQIIGIPGVGRSSLLGLLSYNREVRLRHFPTRHGFVHFIMVNFSEVRKRPLFDVMKLIFLNLTQSLRERSMAEEYAAVDKLFKDALSYNDELVLTQGLKNAVDYLSLEKKLTLIFLFDKFDEYVPALTPQFFTNLRSLRDRAKYRFSCIFSLTRPLEDTIEQLIFADFSDFVLGHFVYLSLYDKPSVDFRFNYLEKITGKHLTPTLREEIVNLTGGHLRLSKLAAESLLAQDAPPENIMEFLLDQRTVQSALLTIWQSLSPFDQQILKTQSFSSRDKNDLQYLINVGLIGADGKMTIPLLEKYIQSSEHLVQDEKIVYDPLTNTIQRGNKVLSDYLTKSEFRLLRHLLQNPDRVIEREEIVSVVWKDAKSTAGVSEQAIDQLIFRLRRKIETNPNNPSHILTIKGRGIKYLP
jgi:DNA-binding winged helix-turn-helix (wHTH) protein